MANSFFIQLISPESIVFSGEGQSLCLPSAEGEMTIMAHHAPLVAQMIPGFITIEGQEQSYFALGGFVHIDSNGSVKVIAETLIRGEEVTAEAINHYIEKAKQDLATMRAQQGEDASLIERANQQEAYYYRLISLRDVGL